jgi:predicted nucleic acid-binding Zn ribbon protein
MPTYVYKFVKTGETIEVTQAFTDPALTEAKHPTTGRRMTVKKVFTPVGVTFRGDGFYKNDSRNSGGAKKATTNGEAAASTGDKADKPDSSGGDAAATSSTKDAAPSKGATDATAAKKPKAATSST